MCEVDLERDNKTWTNIRLETTYQKIIRLETMQTLACIEFDDLATNIEKLVPIDNDHHHWPGCMNSINMQQM